MLPLKNYIQTLRRYMNTTKETPSGPMIALPPEQKFKHNLDFLNDICNIIMDGKMKMVEDHKIKLIIFPNDIGSKVFGVIECFPSEANYIAATIMDKDCADIVDIPFDGCIVFKKVIIGNFIPSGNSIFVTYRCAMRRKEHTVILPAIRWRCMFNMDDFKYLNPKIKKTLNDRGITEIECEAAIHREAV
jgi:hypothetical protein